MSIRHLGGNRGSWVKSQNTFAYHGTDEWANWMIDLHRKNM